MDDLFRSYWWLLFPLGFFVFGAWDRWLNYQRSRDHLELLRTYTAQGKDIPPELLRVVRQEVEDEPPPYDPYDKHSRRAHRRYWRYRYASGPYWLWRGFIGTGAVAAGFWIASEYTDWPGIDAPFRVVAIILTCVAAGNLIGAIFSTVFPRR